MGSVIVFVPPTKFTRRIGAILILRQHLGLGLKEAKEIVERGVVLVPLELAGPLQEALKLHVEVTNAE